MKTVITIVVEHPKPMENIGQLVAQRAWTIDGIEFVSEPKTILIGNDGNVIKELPCTKY